MRAHTDHFRKDEDDPVWIANVAARGWVIVSSDGRISKDPLNVHAVMESKAQVVMTHDNNTLPEYWGAALIAARLKLGQLLDQNPGPVFIRISQHSSDNVRIVKEHILRAAGAERKHEEPAGTEKQQASEPVSSEVRGSDVGRAPDEAGAEGTEAPAEQASPSAEKTQAQPKD